MTECLGTLSPLLDIYFTLSDILQEFKFLRLCNRQQYKIYVGKGDGGVKE